ncbi:uncharacterized protein LOC125033824 isoform X3 [Penaeus chinensis]|nr:uncharacterized protein LOC125033824 isoform X3 [Penaeus chinensis]
MNCSPLQNLNRVDRPPGSRLFYGEMLAQVSRYPLRVPVRIMPGSRRPQAVHQDRFIQQGAALLAGLGLCISSFSLKKLSAMPHKPRRLI